MQVKGIVIRLMEVKKNNFQGAYAFVSLTNKNFKQMKTYKVNYWKNDEIVKRETIHNFVGDIIAYCENVMKALNYDDRTIWCETTGEIY